MELTDEQWEAIRDCFPKRELRRPGRQGGRPWCSARCVLEGVLWSMRTGAPWADLPSQYPSYQTCHRRFQKWVKAGVMERILAKLRASFGRAAGLEDVEGFIDGTYVPAKSGGDVVGKCRAGNATKVVAITDRDGLPLSVIVASGSRHDVVLTERALDSAFVAALPPRLIGDKAYPITAHRPQIRSS